MARRIGQNQPNTYNIDLDTLLMSDDSQEEEIESCASSSESSKHPKKFKNKDSKPLPANKIYEIDQTVDLDVPEQSEEVKEIEDYDVSNFFESIGNDLTKSMQLRKNRLSHFTNSVISIYQSKLTEMAKKHESEIIEFKDRASNNIREEFEKLEEELKKLKVHENKIIRALEQQLKMFQKTSATFKTLFDNLRKTNKNLIQTFEDLKVKHRNEALEVTKSVGADMSALQNKFLAETKKEEMQIVKKYFTAIYF